MRLVIDQLKSEDGRRTNQVALAAFEKLTKKQADFLNSGWSAEEIFWSRYFWIKVYANIRTKSSGPDAGLDQFIFKLLEDPAPKCEPDWNVLEKIEQLAKQEALHWHVIEETDVPDRPA